MLWYFEYIELLINDLWPVFPMKNYYIYNKNIIDRLTVLNYILSTSSACFSCVWTFILASLESLNLHGWNKSLVKFRLVEIIIFFWTWRILYSWPPIYLSKYMFKNTGRQLEEMLHVICLKIFLTYLV